MPSANGHGARRAVAYYRVSSDEQKRTGYSIPDMRTAVPRWCGENGYELVGEFEDSGWSGGDLMRPGLDRLRERVREGGIGAVVVLFRDRLARGIGAALLAEEFAESGCSLIALNAQLDDSPEGELQGGLLDVISAWERRKIAERTARGKAQKARSGKVVIGGIRPLYGFRPSEDRDAYEAYEPEMGAVRRVVREVAEGASIHGVKRRLEAEGVPSPSGGRWWATRSIRRLLTDDAYAPHSRDDLFGLIREGLLSHEAGARAEEGCGILFYNRHRTRRRKVPAEGGGYRTRTKVEERPRSEWIAVPVPPSGLHRRHVEAARAAVRDDPAPVANGWGRTWELSGGLFRCQCGRKMACYGTQTGRKRHPYHYYVCSARRANKASCQVRQGFRAEEAEGEVWRLVRGLMTDPERLRVGLDAYLEAERAKASPGGDPAREAKAWATKLREADRKRGAYQDQQAEGLITMDELREKLAALEETRKAAREALKEIAGRSERLAELEAKRDALLADYAGTAPERLDALTHEQRNELYRALGLRFVARPGRVIEASGPLVATVEGHSDAANGLHRPPPVSQFGLTPPR